MRPRKLAFDMGGYYGAGTKGIWINHLKWFDWGAPVAFAEGTVHARRWPRPDFMTTPGGVMLDGLRSCPSGRLYYTSVSMVAPAGFPENTESDATGMSEQALTPC